MSWASQVEQIDLALAVVEVQHFDPEWMELANLISK